MNLHYPLISSCCWTIHNKDGEKEESLESRQDCFCGIKEELERVQCKPPRFEIVKKIKQDKHLLGQNCFILFWNIPMNLSAIDNGKRYAFLIIKPIFPICCFWVFFNTIDCCSNPPGTEKLLSFLTVWTPAGHIQLYLLRPYRLLSGWRFLPTLLFYLIRRGDSKYALFCQSCLPKYTFGRMPRPLPLPLDIFAQYVIVQI